MRFFSNDATRSHWRRIRDKGVDRRTEIGRRDSIPLAADRNHHQVRQSLAVGRRSARPGTVPVETLPWRRIGRGSEFVLSLIEVTTLGERTASRTDSL